MGPSGWWPAETKRDIIAGAILVQNTAWQNADTGLQNLKQQTGLVPQQVLALSHDELVALIKSSGFYHNKAKAIHAIFQWFEDRHWDYQAIWQANTSTLRRQLLALPAVGNETADVLLVYIFDQPYFIADTYTRRLFQQLGFLGTDTYAHLAKQVTLPANFTGEMAQDFHGLLDEFGKQYLQHPNNFDSSFLATALMRQQKH